MLITTKESLYYINYKSDTLVIFAVSLLLVIVSFHRFFWSDLNLNTIMTIILTLSKLRIHKHFWQQLKKNVFHFYQFICIYVWEFCKFAKLIIPLVKKLKINYELKQGLFTLWLLHLGSDKDLQHAVLCTLNVLKCQASRITSLVKRNH